jgi:hypothetical protein
MLRIKNKSAYDIKWLYKLNTQDKFQQIFIEISLDHFIYLSVMQKYEIERNYGKMQIYFWLSPVHSLYTLCLYKFIVVQLCWKLKAYWNTLESVPGTNQY